MSTAIRTILFLTLVTLLSITILIQRKQIRQHQADYAALQSELSHVRTLNERSKRPSFRRDPPRLLPALASGTTAPEWRVSKWTDGRTRTLADYRGKVVVLDFWGVWCQPCIKLIPEMKKLHDRFKANQVVFLGIHTAGSEVSRVKEVMDQHGWNIAVGVDSGDDIPDGETVRSYAVQGFPSLIVIDREGLIAFNGADPEFLKKIVAMAESSDPPLSNEHAGDNEHMNRVQQWLGATYGRIIEEVLRTQTD